jgi:pilus assembly protein Flp/PilA
MRLCEPEEGSRGTGVKKPGNAGGRTATAHASCQPATSDSWALVLSSYRILPEFHFNEIKRILLRADSQGFSLYASRWNSGKTRGASMKIIIRFLSDESGATAIEYSLIAAGIAIAIITAVKGVGSALSTKFTAISTSLK